MKRLDFEAKLQDLALEEMREKVRKAKTEADQAVIEKETAEMQQRFCAEMIAKDRNPLANN